MAGPRAQREGHWRHAKRGVISAETERAENARRGILGPEFDEDEEVVRIATEQEGMEPEVSGDEDEPEIDPVTGKPIEKQAV